MMGTERLFDADAYRTEFSASVVSCEAAGDGYAVILDRTAFFPEAGGQTPDKGTITAGTGADVTAAVYDVQTDEATGIITHYIDREILAGTEITGRVDWGHRFDNMQQHSAEHIISGLVCGRFGCDNVGFHLSDHIVTMDYNRALTDEELAGIEAEANRIIWRDLPIEVSFPGDEELAALQYRSKKELSGQIRIVTIPGVDVCACCAPHVRHTGEIGLVKILSSQSHKGGVRVTICAGKRALEHLSRECGILSGMAREMSTSTDEVPGHVTRLREELSEAKRQVSVLGETYLASQLRDLSADGNSCVTLFADQMLADCARRAANSWAENAGGLCAMFFGADGEYRYLAAAGKKAGEGAEPGDARKIAALLREKTGAKGGGSPEMVQGSISGAAEADIRAALSEL